MASLFVGLQLCVAVALAVAVGFTNPPPFGRYGYVAIVPVLFYVAGLTVWRLRTRPDSPITYLLEQDWSEVLQFAFAMFLVWLQFLCLTWMKAMIPHASSMWADVPLANLEAAILGRDAWHLFPVPGVTIDFIYAAWLIVTYLAFVGAFFLRNGRRDAVLLSFFLTIGLLGTFGQYLLPSGGPIFYERLGYGDRFAAMQIPELASRTSDYLFSAYSVGGVEVGTGISAFPSIHVATATWLVIAFRHPASYLWLGVIFAGSVMLGWHYALDGVGGIFGAILCYSLARLLLPQRVHGFSDKAQPAS